MSLQTTYAFVVVVSALDGRSDTKRVLITAVDTGGVKLYVNTSLIRFNPGSKLIVSGRLFASNAVTSMWSVLSPLGVSLSFKALTSVQTNFTFASTNSYISFPVAFKGGTFTPGCRYSFRLTAYPMGHPKQRTSSEITLKANSLPIGGYLVTAPSSGIALVTQFTISTPGWTAEAENLPLSYSFSYTVSELAQYLTLATSSFRAHIVTTLPPGLSALQFVITLQSRATDYLFSSATATNNVTVTLDPKVNLSSSLNISLSAALVIGNINKIFQAVNNVRNQSIQRSYKWHPFNE